MGYVTRPPSPALAPFVEFLWAYDGTMPDRLERILPSGEMSLLVNLHEDEMRSYHGDGLREVRRFRGAVVSGAHAVPFAIDTREQRDVVGVQFRFGGAAPFLRATCDAAADLHVDLDDLWGRDGAVMRERMLEAPAVAARLDLLDQILCERIVRPLVIDGAIARAVTLLERDDSVAAVAAHLGLSARTFHRRFTAAVGLTPKRFARVRRFQRVLDSLTPAPDWAAVAVDCGYYDQAHLIHEFRDLAAMTPAAYAAAEPRDRNHVVLTDSSNPAP